jgi:hypothetical protein
VPQPRAEERDHRGVGVREGDCPLGLSTFAGVEGEAGGQECVVAQSPDPADTRRVELRDLTLLREAGGTANLGGISIIALLISTATGFRSLA